MVKVAETKYTKEWFIKEINSMYPFSLRYRKLNRVARELYLVMGYTVDVNFDFLSSRHPQEQLMFQQAMIAEDMYKKKSKKAKESDE